jgi:hypothetical protein
VAVHQAIQRQANGCGCNYNKQLEIFDSFLTKSFRSLWFTSAATANRFYSLGTWSKLMLRGCSAKCLL